MSPIVFNPNPSVLSQKLQSTKKGVGLIQRGWAGRIEKEARERACRERSRTRAGGGKRACRERSRTRAGGGKVNLKSGFILN